MKEQSPPRRHASLLQRASSSLFPPPRKDPVCRNALTSHSLLNLRKNSSLSNLLLWSGTTRGIFSDTSRPLEALSREPTEKKLKSACCRFFHSLLFRVCLFFFLSLSPLTGVMCLLLLVCVTETVMICLLWLRVLRAPARLRLQMSLMKWPAAIDKAQCPCGSPSLSSSLPLSRKQRSLFYLKLSSAPPRWWLVRKRFHHKLRVTHMLSWRFAWWL